MALFKPFRGSRASLDAHDKHDGYAYFCVDDGTFHIDYLDADGNLQRKQISAKDAETLESHSADEFILKTELLQSDWAQTDETKSDYIKNKPDIDALQPKTDEALETLSKTVVGAINEVNSVSAYLIGEITEGLAYTLSDDGTYYICSGMGTATATEIVIAPIYNGLPVKEVGASAFRTAGGKLLTSVTIPEGIIKIGASAFRDCTAATRFSLPNTLTTIGSNSFQKCTALTSIVIPDGVTEIEQSAFNGCTALAEITIGKSVKTMGAYALQNCTGLSYIRFNAIEMNNLSKTNYVLLSCGQASDGIDILIDRNVKAIPANLFHPSSNVSTYPKLVSVRFEDNSICKAIDEQVFAKCYHLSNINLPHGLLEIKANAFESCTGLTRVTIPDTVISIETYAFRDCANLEYIEIPDSVLTIGASALRDCPNLKHVRLPNGLEEISKSLFEQTIPDTEPDKKIEASIQSVIIPKSVTTIAEEVFLNAVELSDIYYTGTEEEWNNITFVEKATDPADGVDCMPQATIHYNFADNFMAVNENINRIVVSGGGVPTDGTSEGAFLRFVDGEPKWVSIQYAEGNLF